MLNYPKPDVENYKDFTFKDQVKLNSDTIAPDSSLPVDFNNSTTPSPVDLVFEIASEICMPSSQIKVILPTAFLKNSALFLTTSIEMPGLDS